jgi:hypothetical protein
MKSEDFENYFNRLLNMETKLLDLVGEERCLRYKYFSIVKGSVFAKRCNYKSAPGKLLASFKGCGTFEKS